MSRVRVHNFSISLDGFATGEGQSLDAPFGHAGHRLHEWFFPTRSFPGRDGAEGSSGVDNAMAAEWATDIGAEIMGRNKFGPQRGPWEDHEWTGWWGPNPPFRTPVFVLTHHARPSIEMEGATTFHLSTLRLLNRSTRLGTPREGRTYASAAAPRSSVSSLPPGSSTICTSWWSRS